MLALLCSLAAAAPAVELLHDQDPGRLKGYRGGVRASAIGLSITVPVGYLGVATTDLCVGVVEEACQVAYASLAASGQLLAVSGAMGMLGASLRSREHLHAAGGSVSNAPGVAGWIVLGSAVGITLGGWSAFRSSGEFGRAAPFWVAAGIAQTTAVVLATQQHRINKRAQAAIGATGSLVEPRPVQVGLAPWSPQRGAGLQLSLWGF